MGIIKAFTTHGHSCCYHLVQKRSRKHRTSLCNFKTKRSLPVLCTRCCDLCTHTVFVGKYQLIYFPVRGLGEAIRLLFKDNGIDYEEITCQDEVWLKQWKPKMQFGQVPCLKDNELQLVQSNAILRHLARKHGLYGDTQEEAAQIDMINDGVGDLRKKYATMIYTDYEKGKDEYIAGLPTQLQYFENLLAANGADKTGCCVGSKKSFADYNLIDLLDVHQVLAPKCLDDFPTLSAYLKMNLARPGIVEYRQTDGFKERKINGNGKQ